MNANKLSINLHFGDKQAAPKLESMNLKDFDPAKLERLCIKHSLEEPPARIVLITSATTPIQKCAGILKYMQHSDDDEGLSSIIIEWAYQKRKNGPLFTLMRTATEYVN